MKFIFSAAIMALVLSSCGTESVDESTVAAQDYATETAAPPAVEPATDDQPGLALGEVAPDFSLTGTDGATHSLATIKDANGDDPKGYVVVFTCNTCPYAQGYESRLAALHEKLSPMGYPLVAIQPNDVDIKPADGMEAMKKRKAEAGFGFAYLLDDKQEVYPAYGARKTPEIYLLDADRVLRYHGAVDDSAQDEEGVSINYVENAVMALEAGETPDPADVKAIGCGIKAKK